MRSSRLVLLSLVLLLMAAFGGAARRVSDERGSAASNGWRMMDLLRGGAVCEDEAHPHSSSAPRPGNRLTGPFASLGMRHPLVSTATVSPSSTLEL